MVCRAPKCLLALLVITAVASCAHTSPQSPVKIPSTGFFTCDTLRIHYESFGAGAPLVLVHGWGSDIRGNWIDTGWIDALKSERLLIAVDIRGHGQSDKPHDASAYSYSAMSRDVLALMDHLGIDKADYMGYSMGAFMGAWLLGHHADRFNSMILGGIGNETPESANACIAIADALRTRDPAQITDPLGRAYRAYAQAIPTNDLEALALSALQMWPEGYPLELGGDGLRRVDVPVLIVNGADDHPYVDSDELLAQAIPGAKLLVIPDRNHLSAVTDPRFKSAVIEFLARRNSV